MTPIRIAVGYVRCSTDRQDDSIEQQKKSIETWAKTNGYTIIEWFEDEGKSGTSFDKRPAFMRMAKRIESTPNFEHVLVYDESRWGRAGNPRESTYWKVHLARHGVKVRIVNSQSKNENYIRSFVVEVVESAETSEYSKKLYRSAAESGIGLDTVVPRIKEIEAENERLDRSLGLLRQMTISQEMIRDAASEAALFMRGFEEKVSRAPILEQKLMIRPVVEGITVDREKDMLECRLLRVPRIESPILKSAFQNRAVQSRVCPEQDPAHRWRGFVP